MSTEKREGKVWDQNLIMTIEESLIIIYRIYSITGRAQQVLLSLSSHFSAAVADTGTPSHPRTGAAGRPPVPGLPNRVEQVELVLFFQAVVNQRPSAGNIGIDLAAPILGPAARPVEQALGTSGHGTDAAGVRQHAVSAPLTDFLPYAGFTGGPVKGGVQRRDHRQRFEHIAQGLNSAAAGQRQDRLGAFRKGLIGRNEVPFALSNDRIDRKDRGTPSESRTSGQLECQLPGLAVTPGKTNRHATPAADYQNFAEAR